MTEPQKRYRVEVLTDGRWQKMKHVFDERRSAENIARAARGASDCQDSRVIEDVSDTASATLCGKPVRWAGEPPEGASETCVLTRDHAGLCECV